MFGLEVEKNKLTYNKIVSYIFLHNLLNRS